MCWDWALVLGVGMESTIITPYRQNLRLKSILPLFDDVNSGEKVFGRASTTWEEVLDVLDVLDYGNANDSTSPSIFKTNKVYREVLECLHATYVEDEVEILSSHLGLYILSLLFLHSPPHYHTLKTLMCK